eukprot:5162670-Pyramimonas_sp.AAC.1
MFYAPQLFVHVVRNGAVNQCRRNIGLEGLAVHLSPVQTCTSFAFPSTYFYLPYPDFAVERRMVRAHINAARGAAIENIRSHAHVAQNVI